MHPRLAALLLALLASAACSASPEQRREAVLETEWRLVELGGRPPLTEFPITLRIADDGGVSGTAGVNRYSAGSALAADGRWRVESPVLTRMAGPPAAMDQEQLYLRLLVRGDGWRAEGKRFEVVERGRPLLRFERAPKDA